MKKLLFVLLLTIFTTSVYTVPISADEATTETIIESTLEAIETIESPGINFSETTENLISGNISFSFHDILQFVIDALLKEIKENLSILIKMLVLAILAGVLCNLQQSAPEDGTGEIAFLACYAVIAGLSVTIVTNLATLAAETIDSLLLFIGALMPVLCSLVSSTGQAALNGFYPTLFLAMQTFVAICRQFFLPFITATSALAVISSMSNRFQIAGLLDTARKIIKWSLGILLTVFVGILGIHGFSAFTAGSVAGRTVKYALGNFIPIVGGVLSESIEAVIASLRLIRGSVGIAGMLVLITACALPLFKILSISFLYRFGAGIAEPATDKRIVRLLTDLSGNMTLIFVILLMVTVMFIISIALLCGFLI